MVKKFRWLLEFLAVLILVFPLALLPLPWVRPVGRTLGRLLYGLFPNRRRIALRNTELVYGEPRPDIVRAVFNNLGILLLEVVRLGFGREDIFRTVRVRGGEHFFQARASGRPVIVVTAHTGNWELLSNAAAWNRIRTSTVIRPLNNPYTDRIIERIRSRYGNDVISKWGALRGALKILSRKGTFAIVIDQGVVPSEGLLLDFLGKPAYAVKMPAVLARKTGAVVVPIFIRRLRDGHEIVVHRPLPLARSADGAADMELNTRFYQGAVERHVRAHPEDWLWIHRRWKRAADGD